LRGRSFEFNFNRGLIRATALYYAAAHRGRADAPDAPKTMPSSHLDALCDWGLRP
jgi:hypothetical protein